MNEIQQKISLKVSQMLIEKEQYEQALNVLETMECVMASWLKGKIYLSFAENIENTFQFKFHATNEIKSKHRDLLNEAYDYFCKAAHLLPAANDDVRDYLNQHLWNYIAKVERDIARTRILVDDDNCDIVDPDFIEIYEQQRLNDIIEDISELNL